MKLLTSNFLKNGDVFTAYNDTGRGEPLVLLHGFMGSKTDFHDHLRLFSTHRRVLAFDQRGHGETSNLADASRYSLKHLVDDLANFLDHTGVKRCDLLGHSMGGMVAMRYALEFSERVRSLLLISTSASPVAAVSESVRRLFCRKVRKNGCSVMLKTICNHPLACMQNTHLSADEKRRQLELLAVKYAQMDPEAFVALSAEITRHQSILPHLRSISCPTTVIYGELDEVFRAPARDLAKVIPDALLVEIPAAAHSPHTENRPRWQQEVQAHLQRASANETPHSPPSPRLRILQHSQESRDTA